MLKEAYDRGTLAACVDAGLIKEAGVVTDVAGTAWKAMKRRAKNIGKDVRDAAAALRKAKASKDPLGPVSRKFVEGFPGKEIAVKNIPDLEKKLLQTAKPWLVGAGIGAGTLGAGYGGYKGMQALFPDSAWFGGKD